jgi:hypothetical protein
VSDDEMDDEQHVQLATEMWERWSAGEAKSQLEIEYWGNATSHGKAFTAYVKKWTGRATERKSTQTLRIERLEGLLRSHGIPPGDAGDLEEEYRLLARSRESALAAVRIHNDPLAGFRTETFIVLMVIAWNTLFQAMLERRNEDYYERDDDGRQVLVEGRPKVVDTGELAARALPGDPYRALRANLDFFLGLRNRIAHRYIPALDNEIIGEAQAMLLTFERTLTDEFGPEAALGDRLVVPLQLSGFRNPAGVDSLRVAQAQLPTDVSAYLADHRRSVPDDVLNSPDYCLQIFFKPVTANRERSADAVVRFLPPGQPDEVLPQLGVVTKRRVTPVASADLLRPTEVVNLVTARLPFRFTTDTHTRCWRYYQVRPAADSGEPEATKGDFCRWDRLHNGYGYTQAWVEKLVKELSNPGTYQKVVGFPPEQR